MIRQIIEIEEDKCNGCGICVTACHEGAIGLVDGKAKLLRDDYCDGLGNCLPACPTGAINFVQREAAEFDEAAVKANEQAKANEKSAEPDKQPPLACGCPGSHAKAIIKKPQPKIVASEPVESTSQLNQWPVQIQLVPINASYFKNANLLIAADCAAYAHGNFHNQFMKNKITIIGCPKLDDVDYSEKLTAILKNNDIKSVTVVRMEVPCCSGIAHATINAVKDCGKMIPWQVVTLSTDGQIIE